MENVSKALAIAGGVMIAIMVTGLIIFGFQKIRGYQKTKNQADEVARIAEFNNQLEAYNKQVVPGYQLISLAHLVQDLNKKSEGDEFEPIKLEVKLLSNKARIGLYSNTYGFGDDFLTR